MSLQFDMFDTVVKKLVKAIGPDLYIPSSSIAASENTSPLALVERKASRWWFGSNSYYSTEFSLPDVLDAGEFKVDAQPAKILGSFNKNCTLKVNGSISGHFREIFDAELSNIDTITIKASLTDLSFTEVSQQELLDNLQNRKLNMRHELVRELLDKNRRALCVVTGVVKTTVPTTITAQLNFKISAEAKASSAKIEAGAEIKGDVEDSRDRVQNLPAGTVLAYQLAELSVGDNGALRLMVSHGAQGGFHSAIVDVVDAVQVPDLQLETLQKDLEGFHSLDAALRKSLTKQLLIVSANSDTLLEFAALLYSPEGSASTDQVAATLSLLSEHRRDADVTLALQVLCRALRNLDEETRGFLSVVPLSDLPLLLSVVKSTYTGESLVLSDPLVKRLISGTCHALIFLLVGADYRLDGDALRPPVDSSVNLLNSVYAAVYGLHACYY